MEKNLYIDASHPNETRVVLKSAENIEDYEYEGLKNNLIKNNIYLGRVSRIEPSLQAAFVDFGRERHGFLSFNDIQSDYYQIPKSDLEIIKQEEKKVREELSKEDEAKENKNLEEGKLEIDDPIEKKENVTEKDSSDYEKKESKFRSFINYAPFAKGMPKDAPARVAYFIGYKMVNEYMNNNKIDIEELMYLTDSRQFLRQSKYKPTK